MSTSALKKTRKHYLYAAIFCLVFAGIYEVFSHSVYSLSMIFSFLWPLIGGVFVYTLLIKARPRLRPSVPAALLYNSGIALFALGSIFRGVLEIYGTTNRLLNVYLIGGFFFLLSGLLTYILQSAFCAEENN